MKEESVLGDKSIVGRGGKSHFALIRNIILAVLLVITLTVAGVFTFRYFTVDYHELQTQATQKSKSGDYKLAKALLLKAESKGGNKDYTVYFDLADVSNYLKDTEGAKKYAETGLKLQAKIKDPKEKARSANGVFRMESYLNSIYVPNGSDQQEYTVPASKSSDEEFQG